MKRKLGSAVSVSVSVSFAFAFAFALLCSLSMALGCSTSVPSGVEGADVDAAASPDAADASGTGVLSRLGTYLRGDFDNTAQVKAGFGKLVERHVCAIPGRPSNDKELWAYVEQVEVKPEGRDAYYTRVVVFTPQGDDFVSKIYKFQPKHPLASDAFKFNGTRDGCLSPKVLEAITESDLVYRDGCDVTFRVNGSDRFTAQTTGTACSFPGGRIETTADVFADGLDTQDQAISGGQKTGDEFKFRRVIGWKPEPPASKDASAD